MALVVGLTGGIATGKSTVSRYLESKGFAVVDADAIAKTCVAPGSIGLQRLVAHFGVAILDAQQRLDRKRLAQRIFNNLEERQQLNTLIHPLVFAEVARRLEALQQHPLIFIDMPLLYETEYDHQVDYVLVVAVPQTVQLERLMQRDGLSEQAAQQRLNSQWSIDEKVARADFVVDNTHSLDGTYQQVDAIVAMLIDYSKTKKVGN